MRVIEFEMSVGTRYIGSTVTQKITLDFDDDVTEEEIESAIEEEWIQFRIAQCDGNWNRLSDVIIDG